VIEKYGQFFVEEYNHFARMVGMSVSKFINEEVPTESYEASAIEDDEQFFSRKRGIQ
jgi:hypothetical protein